MSRLTDTQLVILSSASRRNDRGVDLPANVTDEAVGKAVHKLIHAGRYSAAHVEKADEKFGVVSEAVRPVSR